MRITTRGRYALRSIIALAKLSEGGEPVSINHLSESENISSVFLEQIFFRLRKAGIVSSVRGPGGGFCFAMPLNQITIKHILDSAGEDLNLIFCDKKTKKCDRMADCMCHNVWNDVNDVVNNFFSELTLSAVLEKYGALPVSENT